MILSGLVVSSIFSALVSMLQFVADPNTSLPAIVYWLMGSFATATWERTLVAVPGLVIGIALLVSLRFRLPVAAAQPHGRCRMIGLEGASVSFGQRQIFDDLSFTRPSGAR